jgi:hypothetical protein
MPSHPDDDVISLAIQYMYGFGITDLEQEYMCDFHLFPRLAATAERYEVIGMAEFTFETACRIVDDRLDHPAELDEFLGSVDVNEEICHPDPSHARFTLRFLMKNLAKLRTQSIFRKLCSELQMKAVGVVKFVAENPKLAVDFVKFVAEIQTGTEAAVN